MAFPTGEVLATKDVDGDSISAYTVPVPTIEVTFDSAVSISSGAVYAIIVSAPDAVGDEWNEGMSWRLWGDEYYTNGTSYTSANSGTDWSEISAVQDFYFITKAGETEKDQPTLTGGSASIYFGNTTWKAQSFTASSSYQLTSVVLQIHKYAGVEAGDLTVSLWGVAAPDKASNPSPADTSINQRLYPTYSWTGPESADSYNVHFETGAFSLDLEGLTEAEYVSEVLAYINAGLPDYGTTISWRVDCVNEGGTTTGDTWTFTTMNFDPVIGSWTNLPGKTLGPLDGGVEGTDFVWQGLNTIITIKKLIAAAGNAIWYS